MIRTFEQIYKLNEDIESEKSRRKFDIDMKHRRGRLSDTEYEKALQNLDRWATKKEEQEISAKAAIENDDVVKVFISSHTAHGSWGVPGINYYTLEGPLSKMKRLFSVRNDDVYDDKTLVKELKKRVKKDMEQFYKTRNEGYDPSPWKDYEIASSKVIGDREVIRTEEREGIIKTEYQGTKNPF